MKNLKAICHPLPEEKWAVEFCRKEVCPRNGVAQKSLYESNGCKEKPLPINPSPNYSDNNEHTGEDDAIMVDLDLCTGGDEKDKFLQGNDLASHHLSELNCITIDDAKAVDLDLRKNDNAEDNFPKRHSVLSRHPPGILAHSLEFY